MKLAELAKKKRKEETIECIKQRIIHCINVGKPIIIEIGLEYNTHYCENNGEKTDFCSGKFKIISKKVQDIVSFVKSEGFEWEIEDRTDYYGPFNWFVVDKKCAQLIIYEPSE